jgi:hypothetical protein
MSGILEAQLDHRMAALEARMTALEETIGSIVENINSMRGDAQRAAAPEPVKPARVVKPKVTSDADAAA